MANSMHGHANRATSAACTQDERYHDMRNDNRNTEGVFSSTIRRPWLLAVALAFVFPACAPDTDDTVEGDLDTDEQMAERPQDMDRRADPMAQRGESSVQLTVEQSPTYGEYIALDDGRPLYLFTADTQGEASACYDACADAWPPVTGDATAESGLDAAMVGTIERDDGTRQATYNGWPLYEFARDSGTQPTGQDIASFGGEWYLIGPNGEQIEASGEQGQAEATEGQNETTEGQDQMQ